MFFIICCSTFIKRYLINQRCVRNNIKKHYRKMSIDYTRQRSYPNRYPDYNQESTVFIQNNELSKDLAQRIEQKEKELFQRLLDAKDQISSSNNYSVYIGSCGMALLLLLKYMKSSDKEYLAQGRNITNIALSHLRNRGISFLQGDAGPLALGFVLNAYTSGDGSPTDLSKRLCALADKDTDSAYELLNGRAGYLLALLFVQRHFSNVIPDDLLRKQISIILQAGIKKAEITHSEAPLRYEWYDTNYLGAAHGVAGILYLLLACSQLLTENEKNKLIQPTLDWLLSQRFPSGNFKSSSGKDEDTLVQWCHGAPGFVNLFLLASEVFHSHRYLDVASQCGDIVWERGLLTKGYSICHGISGNAYSFLELYKVTKDPKHFYRAACFADWCTYHPRNQNLKPDRPLSLFEGLAGLVYFLNDIRTPMVSNFPAFGLM